MRVGRQGVRLGSGRLVDYREGPNVRRTFDGARLDARLGRWTATALALRPRRDRPGAFDDSTDDRQSLIGLQFSGRNAIAEGVSAEVYALGYGNDRAAYAQEMARERRLSLGGRIAWTRDGWDGNWEAVVQRGRFGSGRVRAWTLATETGHTFATVPLTPRLALSANIASGDKDPSDPGLQAFNALYPRGSYFSEDATLGPRNFVNLHPSLTLKLCPNLQLTTDVNWFWRLTRADGVYAPNGSLVRSPTPDAPRFVADAASANLAWQITPFVNAIAIYTRFEPGAFLETTGPADVLNFAELMVRFRF